MTYLSWIAAGLTVENMLVEDFRQLTQLTELYVWGPLPINAYSPILELPMLEILHMGFYDYSSWADDGFNFTPTSEKLTRTSLIITGGQSIAVSWATGFQCNILAAHVAICLYDGRSHPGMVTQTCCCQRTDSPEQRNALSKNRSEWLNTGICFLQVIRSLQAMPAIHNYKSWSFLQERFQTFQPH